MCVRGVVWGESGVLPDAVAVFRNAMLDMSGFADAVAVFGNAISEDSGFADAVAVVGNAILDVSSVATFFWKSHFSSFRTARGNDGPP